MSERHQAEIDVQIRHVAEKQSDGTWRFYIYDLPGNLVSENCRHPGPDFEAGMAFANIVARWRQM